MDQFNIQIYSIVITSGVTLRRIVIRKFSGSLTMLIIRGLGRAKDSYTMTGSLLSAECFVQSLYSSNTRFTASMDGLGARH